MLWNLVLIIQDGAVERQVSVAHILIQFGILFIYRLIQPYFRKIFFVYVLTSPNKCDDINVNFLT